MNITCVRACEIMLRIDGDVGENDDDDGDDDDTRHQTKTTAKFSHTYMFGI